MTKVLIDTSVWIDFFRGSLKQTLFKFLSECIREQTVVLSDIIRHEIVIGARNRTDFMALRRLLSPLECLRISEGDLLEFEEFSWHLQGKGLGGKYTDVAIAFLASHYRIPLLSFDHYFRALSRAEIIQLVTV